MRLYFFSIILAIIAFLILPESTYHHPDDSYLRARYAQNWVEGHGLGYNPNEKILLTTAPLPILVQGITSFPSGKVNHPPELTPLLLLGLGIAAFLRLLHRATVPFSLAMISGALWIATIWFDFGSVQWWLACLSLITLDLAVNQRWIGAGIVSGFTLLLAPSALIFAIFLGLKAPRSYWRLIGIPAMIWYGFAFFYYGWGGLQGLTLANSSTDQSILMVAFAILILFWLYRGLKSIPDDLFPLMIWGLSYSTLAILLKFSNDFSLLSLVMIMMIALHLINDRTIITIGSAIFSVIVLIAPVISSDRSPTLQIPQLEGSKGHYGNDQAAFILGGMVYHLGGDRDPHLKKLVEEEDISGVLLATAPDYIFSDQPLPADPVVDLLRYTRLEDGLWQRSSVIYPWRDVEKIDLTFGTDIHLIGVAADRFSAVPGELIRVRLDWQLDKAPTQPMGLRLEALDFQQAGAGSIGQTYPPEKWDSLETTTYHLVPLDSDALPGLYQINVSINYNGGVIDHHPVIAFKIPTTSTREFIDPPLAIFDDGQHKVDLMQAELEQTDQQVVVKLIWRAGSTFEADYRVFIHLTLPDDVNPLAQADAPPLNGRYPTSIWEPGEVIEDTYMVPLENVPPGQYVIRVGLYHLDKGRLPTSNGDSFIVGEIDYAP